MMVGFGERMGAGDGLDVDVVVWEQVMAEMDRVLAEQELSERK